MPLPFKAPASSALVNSTFLDKTIDDSTIGILSLENNSSQSGDSVVNLQREINLSKTIVNAPIALTNGDQVALDEFSMNQIIRLSGAISAITLNNLVFSNRPQDGARIMLIGQDDTNSVTVNFNDVTDGQYINNSATLKRGYILELVWDLSLQRYLEIGRNF
jgi:hypothetical protein